MLAAGKLEAELIKLLPPIVGRKKIEKATLGALLDLGKKHNVLDRNEQIAMNMVCYQRNYLTHNNYALLTHLIPETILEREGLLASDVSTYIERAFTLTENLNALAEIVERRNHPEPNPPE